MKLIVGLGNPGKRYAANRHNVGFMLIEELARRHSAKIRRRLFAGVQDAEASIFGKRVILAEPMVFMNLSGRSVRWYINKFKVGPSDVLIVCDDANIPIGTVRIRAKGSSGGHNGLQSVIDNIKTEDFARLRIGIGTHKAEGGLSDYVLSDFNKREIPVIEESVSQAAGCCETWVRDGTEKAMNIFN